MCIRDRYYTMFYQLTQLLFCPSSITCVNSMDASYIPIAEARGFTTHWISEKTHWLKQKSSSNQNWFTGPIIDMLGKEGRLCNCTQPAFFFIFSISCFCLTSQQSHPAYHTYRPVFQPGILQPLPRLFQRHLWNMLCGTG